ncbi:hypothetical protein BS47DRAFT_1363522 [Hydnum rufescens UP504]|uniref:CCHC-type domain-containing protein n=1 Tax=Hydnum rufescens UP504 TaxID=1448309 RepID=A0A9P6DR75_9AGAM|nr:hypothetical protein BS47DRAFT_1363522 [Hydnum rufescens UP504]
MSTTTFTHMLGPRSRDTPRFKGKRVLCFLTEYEFCTIAAHLTPSQTICQITRYCNTKSEGFIESLDEYYSDDWEAFKACLLDYYPSEEEKPYYKLDHLLKLVRKDRKLSSVEKFDNYIQEFTIIARALEDRKHSHRLIRHVLRHSKQWTDLTNPPPMKEATQAIKLHLKRDLYHIPDDEGLNMALEDGSSSDTSESDDESGTDNTDDKSKRVKSKKYQSKVEAKQKKEETVLKPLETKAQDSGDLMKSNINDLAEKIRRLTLALGQLDPNKVMRRQGKFTASSIKCFMCGEQGHSLKYCPETKAFIAKKVLKVSSEGRLLQLDGSDLPRRDIDNGGVVRILRDQIANALNVEMEHLRGFELLNQEFAIFGNYEYKVFPAERKQGDGEPKWNEPHTKDNPKGKKAEHPNRAYVELPQRSVNQVPPVENPKVPTILKKETCIAEPTPTAPNEDIEMWDGTSIGPTRHKQKEAAEDKKAPASKVKPKRKSSLEDVVVRDKTDQIKKRASPAYCFANELQEKVDTEVLFWSLMDKEVTVKLGDILGSSFELGKRLQLATKMQRVPIKSEIAGSHNVEATVNSLEHTDESKYESQVPYSSELSLDLASEYLVESSDNLPSTEATELKPGKPPKRPLINRPPKKLLDREINVVAFKSDESEDNYALDDMMVMAKIQGTIMGQACTMLIDSGSELNMMVQSTQVKLELPMDPSGKDWILCGVSGHQVNLVGLCHNVPIQSKGHYPWSTLAILLLCEN